MHGILTILFHPSNDSSRISQEEIEKLRCQYPHVREKVISNFMNFGCMWLSVKGRLVFQGLFGDIINV